MLNVSNLKLALVRKGGNIFVGLVAKIISRVGPVHIQKILGKLVHQLNKDADGFITLHVRPKTARNVVVDTIWECHDGDVGIVIQGPYLSEHNFTLETVRLYRRLFPDSLIVLSTWKTAAIEADIQHLATLCKVVFAERPQTTGSHNFNLQKATTLAGIEAIRTAGLTYCLKCRTDQRIYRPTALAYMKDLVRTYPVDPALNAKGRIVELSIACCRYRPWSACDMLQFGYTTDLATMWDVPDDLRNRTAAEYSSQPYRVIDIVNENVAEIRLHRGYARAIGMSDAPEYVAYYGFIQAALILIDKEAVDAYWCKYNAEEYGWAGVPSYSASQQLSRLSHADWELLVSRNAQPNYEHFAARLLEYEVSL